MLYKGFAFNGKHLYHDFDCYIKKVEMSPPDKKEVRKTVPYMNGSYDFSTLYGGPCFEDRTIKYTIDVYGDDAANLAEKKQDLENWLLPCSMRVLQDDSMPNYYFYAECISVDEAGEEGDSNELTIQFKAYPFKISRQLYEVTYKPSAAADVTINNDGTFAVIPTITCAAAATVVYGGNTYMLGIGEHKSSIFTLKPGNNSLNIKSDGVVTVSFRTEVL